MLVQSTGVPVGPSARGGDFIATLIFTTEPALPSLHRRPENDRFRLDLLVHSIDGKSRRVVPIARDLRLGDFWHGARFEGDDGRLLWFHAHEPMAYDYRANRLIRQKQLPAPGPPPRQGSFVFLAPRSEADRFLSSTNKFGSHHKAALIRASMDAPPLTLQSPGGFLLTYYTQKGLKGTVVIARVTDSGETVWSQDSGLADVDQIIPGTDSTSLIGRRPMVPGKVSEPLLLHVNVGTGAIATNSLWIRP